MAAPAGVRIGKYLASIGVGSRRAADALLDANRVTIAGTLAQKNALVTPSDNIQIDGQSIQRYQQQYSTKLFVYNKPIGEVVTTKPHDSSYTTIYDGLQQRYGSKYVGDGQPRLLSCGRLDLLSSGLLLLTTAPSIAHYLSHPSSQLVRTYEVEVSGSRPIPDNMVKRMQERGIMIDGRLYAPLTAELLPPPVDDLASASTYRYRVQLKEGQNREVRRIFEYFGLRVRFLHRVAFGPYRLLPTHQPGSITQLPISDKLMQFVTHHKQFASHATQDAESVGGSGDVQACINEGNER